VDSLGSLLVSRLLLSFLVAHDTLIGAVGRLGLRRWHALLAAMFAALILHPFQIVFSGHRDQPIRVLPHPVNASASRRVPPVCAKNRPYLGTQIRAASFDSRITHPEQENSHAIQASYLGARGRHGVWRDGDRIGTDAAGSRRVE
jgi:hypothetical protein